MAANTWTCPECGKKVWATTERRLEKAVAKHQCKSADHSTSPGQAPDPNESPFPGADKLPPAREETTEEPSPLEKVLIQLAQAQTAQAQSVGQLAHNQNALAEMLAKQQQTLEAMSIGVQYLTKRFNEYDSQRQPAVSEQPAFNQNGTEPQRAMAPASGEPPAWVKSLLPLLFQNQGGAPANPMAQIKPALDLLKQLRDAIVEPALVDYSRGATDSMDAVIKGLRTGANAVEVATAIKDLNAPRLRAPQTPAVATETPTET